LIRNDYYKLCPTVLAGLCEHSINSGHGFGLKKHTLDSAIIKKVLSLTSPEKSLDSLIIKIKKGLTGLEM